MEFALENLFSFVSIYILERSKTKIQISIKMHPRLSQLHKNPDFLDISFVKDKSENLGFEKYEFHCIYSRLAGTHLWSDPSHFINKISVVSEVLKNLNTNVQLRLNQIGLQLGSRFISGIREPDACVRFNLFVFDASRSN